MLLAESAPVDALTRTRLDNTPKLYGPLVTRLTLGQEKLPGHICTAFPLLWKCWRDDYLLILRVLRA